MGIKTILTVTFPELRDGDITLAMKLSESVNAHLSVLVAKIAAPPPVGEYAVAASEAWMMERREDERHLSEASREIAALFAVDSLSADVTSEYPEQAWADEAIGRRARYADLTIVGPDMLATEMLRAKVIEGVLFSSGRPLLIVPSRERATLTPRRVLVAWDARLEASRAVREALEMLVGADDVRLVLIDPVEGQHSHGEEPGADAATYLARHGVKVTVESLPRQGRAVAEVLRRRAVDFDADLLVMGAYGHSRIRERIFGGVTKSMLENPPVQIMMAR